MVTKFLNQVKDVCGSSKASTDISDDMYALTEEKQAGLDHLLKVSNEELIQLLTEAGMTNSVSKTARGSVTSSRRSSSTKKGRPSKKKRVVEYIDT